MKKIRVAFRFGDTRLFARFIVWWQRHDASHCEVAHKWSGERHECVSASWVDGGVRGKTIEMPASKWRIYEVAGSPEYVREWLRIYEDQKYDFYGLLGFAWRRIQGWVLRKFCSEGAAEILGLKDPWRFDVATLEMYCQRVGKRIQ